MTGKQKTLLLTLYALIVALRSPTLLIHGRIFAEEGPVYFRSAWMSSGLQALLVPHLGYYSLWANLCGVLATLSLEHAAVVFVCCAFVAQLLAGYLVLECEAFEGFASKALALAVLLLASNLEVWLNTINSQFYFAICAAVIFVSQAGRLRLARNAALLLGGLTGPFVASLAPLFVVRAFLQKSKDAVVQASLLMACAVVQAVAVLTQLHSGERQLVFQPKGIAPILLVRYLIPTFFSKLGETASAVVILGQPSRFWGAHLTWHLPFNWLLILVWLLADVGWIALLVWISPSSTSKRLLLIAGWMAVFAMYGALGGTLHVSERYAFSPEVLIGLSLVLGIVGTGPSLRRTVGTILLGCFLFSGALEYFYFHHWVREESALQWSTQISKWKEDPTRQLFVFPKSWPGFTLPVRYAARMTH